MRLAHKSTLHILDFDCECRPLSWYAGDFNSKEITAVSWAWIDPKRPTKALGPVEVRLLGEKDHDAGYQWNLEDMLDAYREAFDAADIVTGHFIRAFDLPLLNGAAIELGLPPFGSKLSQDTKLDLIRFSGHSKSQENLGALLELRHDKVQMSQADWRSANRLTEEGLALVRKRVTGDVAQHIEMRAALLERNMLQPPRLWEGGGGRPEKYTP